MKLIYQPLKNIWVNQAFGENKVCINADRQIERCDGNNPPLGFWSLYGSQGHKGVDLAARSGQPVFNAQRGVVYHIDTTEKSGIDVRIKSYEKGRRFRHIYEHLKDFTVSVGDQVKTGQVIGHADNTGYSSGNHLHLEVQEYIDGQWVHIDPMEVMEMIPANRILMVNNTITYVKEATAKLADDVANYLRRHY